MDPKEFLNAAQEQKAAIIAHRRVLHQNPEVGTHLPHTIEYVRTQLHALGYEVRDICEGGLLATISGALPGSCFLLRADMDALVGQEETELPFRSQNKAMHACGHDMHTAMLLGAAALLQRYRTQLRGTVKLVFQPDEEGFTGAKAMLSAGVLENPAPGGALALHVHSGTPSGMVLYGENTLMAGCTVFSITAEGTGCHGAAPEAGVDPINIAAHIYSALQAMLSREIPPQSPVSLTFGQFIAGNAPNVIPQTAILRGTLRCFDPKLTENILQRIQELSSSIAKGFRGKARVEVCAQVPPLFNDPSLTAEMVASSRVLLGETSLFRIPEGGMGSEDFSVFSQALPCTYLMLGAGSREEDPRFGQPMHNPKVVFNEDVLPIGAALEAWCAVNWLDHH